MFSLAQILNGRTGHPETLALKVETAEDYTIGEALMLNASGKLTKASGDVTVEYISMQNLKAPHTSDSTLYVYKVCDGMIFYTSGKSGTDKSGKHYTIADDGCSVTATAATTGFGAELLSVDDGKLRVFLK